MTAACRAAHKFVRKARASRLENGQKQRKAVQPETQLRMAQIQCIEDFSAIALRLNESCTCSAATAGSGPRHWTLDIRHHAGTTALQLLETGWCYCSQKEFCSLPAFQCDRQQIHNLGSSHLSAQA